MPYKLVNLPKKSLASLWVQKMIILSKSEVGDLVGETSKV